MHRGVFRTRVNVCMTFICGGQRITLGIVPQEFFTLLWCRVSHTRLTNQARLTGQWTSRDCPISASHYWSYWCTRTTTPSILRVLGSMLRFSRLTINIFNYQVVSPAQHSVALRPSCYKHRPFRGVVKGLPITLSRYRSRYYWEIMAPDNVFPS